jgi:hypothetical protein
MCGTASLQEASSQDLKLLDAAKEKQKQVLKEKKIKRRKTCPQEEKRRKRRKTCPQEERRRKRRQTSPQEEKRRKRRKS